MAIPIWDEIDKLINERGSAAILRERIALAKDQEARLQREILDLKSQATKLEAQITLGKMRFEEEHMKANRLENELEQERAENIRDHKGVRFRQSKKTGGKWAAYCAMCDKMFSWQYAPQLVICVTQNCQQVVRTEQDINTLISEL